MHSHKLAMILARDQLTSHIYNVFILAHIRGGGMGVRGEGGEGGGRDSP